MLNPINESIEKLIAESIIASFNWILYTFQSTKEWILPGNIHQIIYSPAQMGFWKYGFLIKC